MTLRVEKSVHVPLPPDEAFRVFTDDIALWWPLDSHSLSASRGDVAETVAMEPRTGGKVTETLPDGSHANWATITDWTPGARLSLDWYVGRDPSEATQISVTFLADADGTRVDLVHDGFENLPERVAETAAGYQSGWDRVLGECFTAACLRKAA
ncbi:MAG: SRPBCC domain-containing protein [Pseudomonadota bacterium]